MFIEPDLCSVLTVKLFTVNKFKMAGSKCDFLKVVKILTKSETEIILKDALIYFRKLASFLESIP